MKDIEKLNYRPFTRFCMSIGAVPSSYLAGLTIEEQLLWLCSYLEKEVIPAVNNNAEAVEELQGLFTELQTYVNNYFDNLDVQEEINNKLDDMAESGELEEIIATYLDTKAVFGFDSVSDMKDATNLIDGSYAKTFGYYSENDGGAALYKIRNITNDDVIDEMFIIEMNDSQNQLIAELVPDKNTVSLKQLGLLGDGTTDETTKLQKAFASTYNIFVNKGTYITNDEILISNAKIVTGEPESLFKAKQGMAIDKAVIKVSHDDVTLDGISVSGNIAQNPIGDVYNGLHGISLIDSFECSNITIKNCNLIDNAYCGYRCRSESINDNISHITFRNNKCLNIDCGFITLSSSTNTTNISDVIITENTFDGHDKSEPISIYHYGTLKNLVVSNNIITNKKDAHAIYVGRCTSENVTINNNVITDVATGIAINNTTNADINNNIIAKKNQKLYQGILITNCSNVKVNNNITDSTTNEAVRIDTSSYIYINDNFMKNINADNNTGYKEGIKVISSTYLYCNNNKATNSNYSMLYNITGSCNHLYIDENNNPSIMAFGFHFGSLTADLTDSNIITNLSVRSNFGTRLASNTNTIVQTYSTINSANTGGLLSAYRFARETTHVFSSNYTWSIFEIYNLIDYSVYTLNIYPGVRTITLTSDTTNNFGITWKTDRTITTPTQIKLMYHNNKMYEI